MVRAELEAAKLGQNQQEMMLTDDRERDIASLKIAAELAKATAKLANENFVNNAPEAVVTQEKARVADFEQQIAQLDEQLARLDNL